jgi:hypothetical protein
MTRAYSATGSGRIVSPIREQGLFHKSRRALLTISCWNDRTSLAAWVADPEHRRAMVVGNSEIFSWFRIRVPRLNATVLGLFRRTPERTIFYRFAAVSRYQPDRPLAI